MTPHEALAEAMRTTEPGQHVYDRLAPLGFAIGPAQEVADGAALARLREALPERMSCSVLIAGATGVGQEHVAPAVAWMWVPDDPLAASVFDGETIAAAADKAREALG